MAKNPRITRETRDLIGTEYLYRPDAPAKLIRNNVEKELRRKNTNSPVDYPGLSAVQKELTKIRKRNEKRPRDRQGLDGRWSVGQLSIYQMPADALPMLMEIYRRDIKKPEPTFSVREAMWVARLYRVIEDPVIMERFAHAYALREQLAWILDAPIRTGDLDITLMRYIDEKTRADVIANPWEIGRLLLTEEKRRDLEKKLETKGYSLYRKYENGDEE